ncbi:MAG: hypothetical protein Q9218_004548 [Villophora microphyllina]
MSSNHNLFSNLYQRLKTFIRRTFASSKDGQTGYLPLFNAQPTPAPLPQYDQVQKLIFAKFPQELVDRVLSTVWDSSFTPGFVFPHQYTLGRGTHEHGGRRYDVARPALLALSEEVQQTFQKRMWAENTWVIGAGATEMTTFLDQLPDEASRAIRKIHLAFSIKDLPGWEMWQAPIAVTEDGSEHGSEQGSEKHPHTDPPCSSFLFTIKKSCQKLLTLFRTIVLSITSLLVSSVLRLTGSHHRQEYMDVTQDGLEQQNGWEQHDGCDQQDGSNQHDGPDEQDASDQQTEQQLYEQEIKDANSRLSQIWWDKFDTIRDLPLTELTLDFTDAVGVDGKRLGKQLMESVHSWAMPSTLVILAQKKKEARKIRGVLRKQKIQWEQEQADLIGGF